MSDYPSDLDPAFVDSAARLSAKFDELTKTTHIGAGHGYSVDEVGPLRGWNKAPFFKAAETFSGQDKALVGVLYEVLNDVWTHSDDNMEGFQSGMDWVLGHWEGNAAMACASYVGNLVGFVNGERDFLSNFAKHLVTYAAIIDGARDNVKKLMDGCVDAWDQATHAGEVAGLGIMITMLASITTGAVSLGVGGAIWPAFAGVAANTLAAGMKADLDLSGKHADIANAYLRACEEQISAADDAVEKVIGDLDRLRPNLPRPPALDGDLKDHSTFHPRGGQPASLTTGVVNARPSKIENTLG